MFTAYYCLELCEVTCDICSGFYAWIYEDIIYWSAVVSIFWLIYLLETCTEASISHQLGPETITPRVPSPCTLGRCRGLIVAVDISILSSDTSPFITNMDLLSPNTTLISTSHSCRSVADKMVRKTLISSTSKISWTIIITGLSWRGHAHFVGKPTSVWLFPINACIYILHVNILSDSGV